MKRILIIIGTRPEAIKLAPVIRALRQKYAGIELRICDTGQHHALKLPIFDFFDIRPDYQLQALHTEFTLADQMAYLLEHLSKVIQDFQPHLTVIQGDTNTALAGAWASFYAGVRVAHVEAGLRTFDKTAPFPEEINRQTIARIADIHFAPTMLAKQHLLQEGVLETQIHLTGNTIVDALHWALAQISTHEPPSVQRLRQQLKPLQQSYDKMLLLTLHRRENLHQHQESISAAIRNVLTTNACFMLWPVHPNPVARQWATQLSKALPNLLLVEPLAYEAFVWAMQQCDLILTDSGGVQEEAPSLGKRVIVMRTHTERPEAQASGAVWKVSVDSQTIQDAVMELLQMPANRRAPDGGNPFGEGNSAETIATILNDYLG
jgi:UDP-N-acetylglucosamine 2-epimerase (non-hydrolysing)